MLELQAFPQLSCDFCEDQRRWDIMTRPDLDEVKSYGFHPWVGKIPRPNISYFYFLCLFQPLKMFQLPMASTDRA